MVKPTKHPRVSAPRLSADLTIGMNFRPFPVILRARRGLGSLGGTTPTVSCPRSTLGPFRRPSHHLRITLASTLYEHQWLP